LVVFCVGLCWAVWWEVGVGVAGSMVVLNIVL